MEERINGFEDGSGDYAKEAWTPMSVTADVVAELERLRQIIRHQAQELVVVEARIADVLRRAERSTGMAERASADGEPSR